MTFQDFSRLLQSEIDDPVTRAMRVIRSRMTLDERLHTLLSDEIEGWPNWNDGGGEGSLPALARA